MHIEKAYFDQFMRSFKRGEFGTQRLGQAFFDYFSLYKMKETQALCALHEADGEEAMRIIDELFDMS